MAHRRRREGRRRQRQTRNRVSSPRARGRASGQEGEDGRRERAPEISPTRDDCDATARGGLARARSFRTAPRRLARASSRVRTKAFLGVSRASGPAASRETQRPTQPSSGSGSSRKRSPKYGWMRSAAGESTMSSAIGQFWNAICRESQRAETTWRRLVDTAARGAHRAPPTGSAQGVKQHARPRQAWGNIAEARRGNTPSARRHPLDRRGGGGATAARPTPARGTGIGGGTAPTCRW